MILADKVEALGAAVDAGQLDRADAVQQLIECADLTELSAGNIIDDWELYRIPVTERPRYRRAAR